MISRGAIRNRDKNENDNENRSDSSFMSKEDSLFDNIGEDQRILEAKYLNEMRNYDNQMIQFDYDRRYIRRRRQALLDKERSLQRREKILNLVSQNSEDKFQISPQDQKDIMMLQKKIDAVQAEIEYQNSLFALISKKLRSTKKTIKVQNYKQEDSNYYFLSLKQQEKDLLEKKNEFESRQIEARRILSEPIDDIRLEELLINDIEEDAELVENQYNSIGKKDEEENINLLSTELNELENSNRQRKKDLIARKSSIEREKKSYLNKKPIFTKKSPSPQKIFDLNNSYAARKDKVSEIINNICNSLAQRQKKLAEDEQKIDEIDAQNKRKRIEVEKNYNQKVNQIKILNTKIRGTEKLKSKISVIEEQIENKKPVYLALCDKKKKIKRRIKVILRDKDYNSMKNAEHQSLAVKLNQRREELVQIDERINQRLQKFKKQEAKVKKEEEILQEAEERIRLLESQVTGLQKKTDKKFKQIDESTAQFEASRIAYLSRIRDVSTL